MLNHIPVSEILFIDIETVPQNSCFDDLTENRKKLWERKMQYGLTNGETPGDVYNRAGIYAEFGKIICISSGYIIDSPEGQSFRVKSFYHEDEKLLINEFFSALNKFVSAGKKRLCAHNGQEFDYPFIARRGLINNLRLPEILDIAGLKPWEVKDQLLDTLQFWKFGDFKHYTSLALLCDIFEIPTPKDDIDGSQVADIYWKEKDIERIVRYCEKDTLAVANLLLRYKGLPVIMPQKMEIA